MNTSIDQKLLDFEDTYIEPVVAARERAVGLRRSTSRPRTTRARTGTEVDHNLGHVLSVVASQYRGGSFFLTGEGWLFTPRPRRASL